MEKKAGKIIVGWSFDDSKTFSFSLKIAWLWWDSSNSEPSRLQEWWEKNSASGLGSPRKRSPVGVRFPEPLILDVPGTATQQVRICGFRRKRSSLDKAPKIRHSVRLNSSESFLETLPSISSETWEMCSSHFWINCISWLSVPCIFRCFSRNCR